MNTYRLSTGERITKAELDHRIREGKKEKLRLQYEEYGYNFCEECKSNDDKPIDCSHIESVDSCQKNGHAERAYDLNNIRILGRGCHRKHDKNCINYDNDNYNRRLAEDFT